MLERLVSTFKAIIAGAKQVFNYGYHLSDTISTGMVATIFWPFIKGKSTPPDAFWTLPTIISLSRMLAGVLIFLYHQHQAVTVPLLMWGGISDHWDGSIARIMGPTRWGVKIDAWCDRIFAILCTMAYWHIFNPVAIWTLVCLELLVLASPLLALAAKQKLTDEDFVPNIFGKWRFLAEFLTLAAAALALTKAANRLLLVTIALVLLAMGQKLIDKHRSNKQKAYASSTTS